jgi:intracellular multiplication protein IcmD
MDQSFGEIASNLFGNVLDIRGIVRAICIITGAALVLGSIFQYKKHRNNPSEVPLSTPIMTLLAGLALIALAFIPLEI